MFDTAQFIADKLDTPDAIIALLDTHCGVAPNREAARKWIERGSLPGEWALMLIVALERQDGTPVSLSAYAPLPSADVFD